MKENGLTLDKLQSLIFGIYDDLKFVLKMGDSQQKRRALEDFYRFEIFIKDQVEEYEKSTGVDFKRIAKMGEGQKGWFFEECATFKKTSDQYQKELDLLIESAKEDVVMPVSSKKRRAKMEKILKTKE